VNGAFEQLVGWSAAELDGKRWEDALSAPSVARKTARELDRALQGRLQSLTLELRTNTAGSLTAVVELSLLRGKSAQCLAIEVTSWAPTGATLGACVGGPVYEVSSRPFGVLKAVASEPSEGEAPALGRPCWEALRGAASMCVGCPAVDATLVPRLGVVEWGDDTLTLVAAQMVDSDTVRVATFELDDDAFESLLRARVERIARRAKLTPREREVFDLIILGRSVRETSAALKISASTAKFHQTNVLGKLGVDSRLDLLRLLA
jgi:DNA-binding CsgD family transcriptional regulator